MLVLCRVKIQMISEIFNSFLHNYQQELKIVKGSDYVFESLDLMDYKLIEYVSREVDHI